MSIETRHFVVTHDGNVREFTADQATSIGNGTRCLPEFAGSDLNYLQVSWTPQSENEIRVQTAGASIHFDDKGRLAKTDPVTNLDRIARFEHDTCVQWALRDLTAEHPTYN